VDILADLLIRPAVSGDLEGLKAISSATWDGYDYLAEVAPSWIEEGGFFVGTCGDTVAACGKLSRLPGGTAWLEGLRVLPAFQGLGYGRLISEFVSCRALEMVSEGSASSIEFCTYYKNDRSIALSRKTGFDVVETFVCLSAWPAGSLAAVSRTALPAGPLRGYPGRVPLGWKTPLNLPETAGWLAARADAWESGGASFFGNRGGSFTLLESGLDRPGAAAAGILAAAALTDSDGAEVMLPSDRPDVVEAFLDRGYDWWEEPREANVLVFRRTSQLQV
jgi:GNAT superfamily N-acetyltransferase